MDWSKINIPLITVLSCLGGVGFLIFKTVEFGATQWWSNQQISIREDVARDRKADMATLTSQVEKLTLATNSLAKVIETSEADKEPFKKDHWQIVARWLEQALPDSKPPSYDTLEREVRKLNAY